MIKISPMTDGVCKQWLLIIDGISRYIFPDRHIQGILNSLLWCPVRIHSSVRLNFDWLTWSDGQPPLTSLFQEAIHQRLWSIVILYTLSLPPTVVYNHSVLLHHRLLLPNASPHLWEGLLSLTHYSPIFFLPFFILFWHSDQQKISHFMLTRHFVECVRKTCKKCAHLQKCKYKNNS